MEVVVELVCGQLKAESRVTVGYTLAPIRKGFLDCSNNNFFGFLILQRARYFANDVANLPQITAEHQRTHLKTLAQDS